MGVVWWVVLWGYDRGMVGVWGEYGGVLGEYVNSSMERYYRNFTDNVTWFSSSTNISSIVI